MLLGGLAGIAALALASFDMVFGNKLLEIYDIHCVIHQDAHVDFDLAVGQLNVALVQVNRIDFVLALGDRLHGLVSKFLERSVVWQLLHQVDVRSWLQLVDKKVWLNTRLVRPALGHIRVAEGGRVTYLAYNFITASCLSN